MKKFKVYIQVASFSGSGGTCGYEVIGETYSTLLDEYELPNEDLEYAIWADTYLGGDDGLFASSDPEGNNEVATYDLCDRAWSVIK